MGDFWWYPVWTAAESTYVRGKKKTIILDERRLEGWLRCIILVTDVLCDARYFRLNSSKKRISLGLSPLQCSSKEILGQGLHWASSKLWEPAYSYAPWWYFGYLPAVMLLEENLKKCSHLHWNLGLRMLLQATEEQEYLVANTTFLTKCEPMTRHSSRWRSNSTWPSYLWDYGWKIALCLLYLFL